VLQHLVPAGFKTGPGALVCLAGTRLPLTAEVCAVPVGWLQGGTGSSSRLDAAVQVGYGIGFIAL
jgi:hypothetical protein